MGVRISELPNNILPYTGSEEIPLVQSGETRAGTLSSFVSYLSGQLVTDSELAAQTWSGNNPNVPENITITGISPGNGTVFPRSIDELNGLPTWGNGDTEYIYNPSGTSWFIGIESLAGNYSAVKTSDALTPLGLTGWTVSGTGQPILTGDNPTGDYLGQLLQADDGSWWRWNGTSWDADVVDNTNVVAALQDVTATITLSVTGGSNKIPLLDASGDLYTGPLDNRVYDGVIGDIYTGYRKSGFGSLGNIYIPDQQGLIWRDPANGDAKAGLRHWTGHDTLGGETILDSDWRIALIPSGPIQLFKNDAGRFPRKLVMSSGYASDSNPAVEYMPSAALAFQTSVWNVSSGNIRNDLTFQAHHLDTTGNNAILRLWDQSSVTNEDGGGNIYTAGRGDVVGNLIGEFYKDGIWSKGNAPEFDILSTTGDTVTQVCSKYKNIQTAIVTLESNCSLTFSGLLAGMRGVIYVTQDNTGSRTLTPLGGNQLDLTTGSGDVTDKVNWEFDGVYVNFTVTKQIQREVIITDADALSFITTASITEAIQKVAINTLTESIKNQGLWDRFHAIYPFVGGTSASHVVDLKGNYSSGSFGGTVVHTNHASGTIEGNGTNGYFDTGFNPASASDLNALGIYAYCRTESPTATGYFGGSTGPTTFYRIGFFRSSSNLGLAGINANNVSGVASAGNDFRKHIAVIRTGATTQYIMVGSTIASATLSSVGKVDRTINFLARHQGLNTRDNFTNANLGFAAITKDLSTAEAAIFREIIDEFQTTLGRNN